jgi:hypothetical protein
MNTPGKLVSALHVATIRGQQLRFYCTPNNDGLPDLPWHCVDDLLLCLGFDQEQRKSILRGFRTGPFPTNTIATEDGLVTIAPHHVAQTTISAAEKSLRKTTNLYDQYSLEMKEAGEILTAGMSITDFIYWMVAALKRHEAA